MCWECNSTKKSNYQKLEFVKKIKNKQKKGEVFFAIVFFVVNFAPNNSKSDEFNRAILKNQRRATVGTLFYFT